MSSVSNLLESSSGALFLLWFSGSFIAASYLATIVIRGSICPATLVDSRASSLLVV